MSINNPFEHNETVIKGSAFICSVCGELMEVQELRARAQYLAMRDTIEVGVAAKVIPCKCAAAKTQSAVNIEAGIDEIAKVLKTLLTKKAS